MNKEIGGMSIVELKAMAYDMIAQAESIQKNLNIVNQVIEKKDKEPKPKPEPKKEEVK